MKLPEVGDRFKVHNELGTCLHCGYPGLHTMQFRKGDPWYGSPTQDCVDAARAEARKIAKALNRIEIVMNLFDRVARLEAHLGLQ